MAGFRQVALWATKAAAGEKIGISSSATIKYFLYDWDGRQMVGMQKKSLLFHSVGLHTQLLNI